ncbi:MAG: LAGLIDADG family homing endonuclease [Candidatus Nanopelagicaceae bacterium]|nr:LAGLIDADG family homing endonuclease [Candidatus Nanopelagicaceae bacterium]
MFTTKQLDQIRAAYQQGESSPEIASKFGVDPETITKHLKRMGVELKGARHFLAAKVDERFFDVIDIEVKAYWLGFLMADACIGKSAGDRRSLRFYLAPKDADVIKQFATDIQFGGKLRTPEVARGQWGICFNSKVFCGAMIEKGYLDWKERGNPRILQHVPKPLLNHFIRGFFDGDGCISSSPRRKIRSYSITIVSHKAHREALDAVRKIIVEGAQVVDKDVKTRSTCLAINWNGNQQVSKIGRWLYRDATRFLARKRARFDELEWQLSGNFDPANLAVSEIQADEYVPFYDAHHYMGSGGRRGYTVGLKHGGELMAAATIGSITRAETAAKQGVKSAEIRELARFCIHPKHHHRNLATWFLSRVVRRFKEENPSVGMLVSFADQTEGHEGTIYRAGNWKYDGKTGRSYHYEAADGIRIHKKSIYDQAVSLGLMESEFVKQRGLKKVKHLPKKRYILPL